MAVMPSRSKVSWRRNLSWRSMSVPVTVRAMSPTARSRSSALVETS